jgi:hypothetical protein
MTFSIRQITNDQVSVHVVGQMEGNNRNTHYTRQIMWRDRESVPDPGSLDMVALFHQEGSKKQGSFR